MCNNHWNWFLSLYIFINTDKPQNKFERTKIPFKTNKTWSKTFVSKVGYDMINPKPAHELINKKQYY